MGHALNNSLQDLLARFYRMNGYETLWQPGTDHAGIATQAVVEKKLLETGIKKNDLGRDKFVKEVWKWKQESGDKILNQLKKLGCSCDWSRNRFTMDNDLSRAVIKAFVKLYNQKLIYKDTKLVNWDTKLETAISDLEVEQKEVQSNLYYIKYKIDKEENFITIATTRPETMLGDTAIAVNPKDDRYKNYIGKLLIVPIVERKVKIIADKYVSIDQGSGALKVTPAHDFNDYGVGVRHKLSVKNILTPDARINDNAPIPYQGLDRYEARKKVETDLQALGLIEKIEPHKLMVPRGDRSNSVVEPYLTDQWFVRVEPLAEPAIRAVENGDIRFFPSNWSKTYFEWMRDIQDWCISRQIWWGHRIPAWYDQDGNVYVARNETEVREKYNLTDITELRQDEDVLDTWFSAALWPFSTLGWPEPTDRLERFYPTNVLVTGFDIIFFWVARMIMMGLRFTGEVPFREVYIHGLVRDADGNKMSKSKGNILDPLDLIDGIDLDALIQKRTTGLMQPTLAPKIEASTRTQFADGIPAYGTDALRFTFCSLATTGRDIRFDLNRIQGYRNFCNKLWNAARYVLMHADGKNIAPFTIDLNLSLADRWIVSLLQTVIQQTQDAIAQYRFDHASQALYEFIWNEFCDWYVEFTKTTLREGTSEELIATRSTMLHVLETTLRLAHPLIPFITEAIWQRVAPLVARKGPTIMTQIYPQPELGIMDRAAMVEMAWVKEFILAVRQIRGEMKIPPSRAVPVILEGDSKIERSLTENHLSYLTTLAKLDSLRWLDTENPPESAIKLVGNTRLHIPIANLIDRDAERERLTREIEKLEADHKRASAKLANPNFVDRAPVSVVEKERARLGEIISAMETLKGQLDRL